MKIRPEHCGKAHIIVSLFSPERAAVNPRKVIRKRFLSGVGEVPHESTRIRVADLFLVTQRFN